MRIDISSALFSASIFFFAVIILVIRSNLGYMHQIDTSLFTTIFNKQHMWRHGHHTKHLQTKQLIPKWGRVEEWYNSSTLYAFIAGKGANLPWFPFILNTYVSVFSKTYSVVCALSSKLLLLRIITLLLNISEKVSNQNWIHEKHSVRRVLSVWLSSENIMFKIYKTIILPLVYVGVKLGLSRWRWNIV